MRLTGAKTFSKHNLEVRKKMIRQLLTFILLIAALAACTAETSPDTTTLNDNEANLPNPASVYCEEQGYTVEMREGADGVYGVCIFPDGSECDEWAYFRGECAPGETTNDNGANLPNPASVYCEEQGYTVEMREGTGGVYGVCIFSDGSECDEWAYFRGECAPGEAAADGNMAGLPNPASVYCEEQGYTVEMREGTGGVYGVCIFPDGSECDEWAYFRGECAPGEGTALAEDGWQIYRNEVVGYTFHYPLDAVIEMADDPLQTVTILGPLVEDEYWPVIYVSHPADREDYRPPEGVDLVEWLIDHNLLMVDEGQPTAETRRADVQIGGETAVHTWFAGSPQAYAYDKYLLAHDDQLYVIVILHAGDREDWTLYNHFLESFQFES
jgi:putative hemolysin